MLATDQWRAGQFMGRRWPIGCVALEVTQRCNLDCTACYLSDLSESVKDLPLGEVFRRIDQIFELYGPDTDIQITGGDPTLRKRDELLAIVRRIRDKGMRPTLFTNGIRARRELLAELVDAGLVDVAFHVDMTQRRRGYESEIALNALRQEYIERVRGLPISVMFNTTVYEGNFDQIPEVVAFFVRNSDVVRLASFQTSAQVGRTVLARRPARISLAGVQHQIEAGAGTRLAFDAAQIGHVDCNRYAMAFVIHGNAVDAFDDKKLFDDILEHTARLPFPRNRPNRVVSTFVRRILTSPSLTLRGTAWLARKVWQAKADLLRARGRVHKLSFFIHDFMDAGCLDPARIEACVFAVATADGPVSMCQHNANRNAFILQPVRLGGSRGERFWDPLSGDLHEQPIRWDLQAECLSVQPNRRVRRRPDATVQA
ncbi:radical SAM domain protein [Burkholderiales bacterium GJ-E10]|nr:radical SAM domain protein [Burkholderiales bacterium GJ-E10]